MGRDVVQLGVRRLKAISIHAPRVGRDWRAAYRRLQRWYFNPRAPCGARPQIRARIGHGSAFQSTRPVWGATSPGQAARALRAISIHAPRVGRDVTTLTRINVDFISIHAPRVGRDVEQPPGQRDSAEISIHAPRVGRDESSRILPRGVTVFQSTRPVWGATLGYEHTKVLVCISIHAPRVGRDMPCSFSSLACASFQSTRPVWGATCTSLRDRPQ